MDPLTRAIVTRSKLGRDSVQSLPRERWRTHRLMLPLLTTWLFASPAWASPPASSSEPDARSVAPAGKQQIGPAWDPERAVWADADARMLVRGDRPENASIHVAYAAPERRWDDALRRQLAAFEDATFPDGAAPQRTIVDKPPEAWMRKLALPDIPVRWNTQTTEYLRYFKDDPEGQRCIATWLNRMGRYETRLRAILKEVGVPEDLVYVAMIESGFDPAAQSWVGAAGMWQFMEPTGKVYGLDVSYWVDDRLDFERSAYAAATYLGDLETRFGSWELALAAYNAGYGLVVQSIRTNNTNNFWTLLEIENALPHQTASYVPKILAAAIVGRNRAVFNVGGSPEPALEWIDVKVPPGTRIEDLGKAIGVDPKLLAEINAVYLRGRVSPEGQPSTVRIPRAAHEAFTQLGGELTPPPDQRWVTHPVKIGEDLDSIAARYGITQKQLRSLNAIHDSGEVKHGVTLVVPADPNTTPLPSQTNPVIAVPKLTVPAGHKLVFMRVTRATSSSAIANAFALGWSQIVAWNDLDPEARLVDGQFLQIIVPESFDASAAGVQVHELTDVRHVVRGSTAHLDAVLADRELERRGYKCGKGETLAKIAKKYELSLGSLARINGVARNHGVREGDVIIVYVAKGKTRGTVAAPTPQPTTLMGEIEVASGAEAGERETDTELPGRKASTSESSRVPGKHYED
jgi:membrane-bound lytic murein transglycosylase D